MHHEFHADVLVSAGARVGEAPRWDGRCQRLVWVDILGRCVHLTDVTSGDDEVTSFDVMVGAANLCDDDNYVLAVANGLRVWRPGIRDVELVHFSGPGRSRSNDAAVDPAGRLLVGMVSTTDPPSTGELVQVGHDLSVRRLADGVGLANGLDWSPLGSTLYFTDSHEGSVGVFDYIPGDGTLGRRRGSIPITAGLPDGHTVDAEGVVWVAQWSAGRVCAYTPEGRTVAVVHVPVPHVTSCALGGEAMDTLLITTMSEGSDDPTLPHQGDLFACTVNTVGAPARRFLAPVTKDGEDVG